MSAERLLRFGNSLLPYLPTPHIIISLDASPRACQARLSARSVGAHSVRRRASAHLRPHLCAQARSRVKLGLHEYQQLDAVSRELSMWLSREGAAVYRREWETFGDANAVRDVLLCAPPQVCRWPPDSQGAARAVAPPHAPPDVGLRSADAAPASPQRKWAASLKKSGQLLSEAAVERLLSECWDAAVQTHDAPPPPVTFAWRAPNAASLNAKAAPFVPVAAAAAAATPAPSKVAPAAESPSRESPTSVFAPHIVSGICL